MKRRLSTASAIVLVLMVGVGWWIANAIDPRLDAADIARLREDTARSTGQAFLDEYVEPDGRVVRRDEGGDVISEGQAYGMLIAVAVGDETRFRSIWEWTKTHLRGADGLLAWRWADNKVTDINSAADADLDAARSLVLAGRRFNAPGLMKDGRRLGVAILETETVAVGTRVRGWPDGGAFWSAETGLARPRTSSTPGTSVLAPNAISSRHRPIRGGRTSPAPSGSWAGSSSAGGCCRPTGRRSVKPAMPYPPDPSTGERPSASVSTPRAYQSGSQNLAIARTELWRVRCAPSLQRRVRFPRIAT
jgi:hypothetical protein